MTKKRRIKSTLSCEPKPQFLRAFVFAALGIVVAVGLGAVSTAQAATINVPADYATIQEAVDAAASGDTIMVGPGEYSGFDLKKEQIKVIGSGPSTRIIDSPFTWVMIFIGPYSHGTEISNLQVEQGSKQGIFPFQSTDCVVSDVTMIAGGNTSINVNYCLRALVTGTLISGTPGRHGIRFNHSHGSVATGNTILGTWTSAWDSAAIKIRRSSDVIVSENIVDASAKYGIDLYQSSGGEVTGNTVQGAGIFHAIRAHQNPGAEIAYNKVSGTWRDGVFVNISSDSTVKGNTIQDFTSTETWGAAIIIERGQNCTVTENELINVLSNGVGIAGVRISGYRADIAPCMNNIIIDNDYKKSGLPGWNKNHPTGPGCVVLEADWWGDNYGAAKYNFVSENHHAYPAGTSICEQILDMTATPENPDGENTEVGMEKCPEVSDYIDRLRDQAERESEEQELQEEEQLLLEVLTLEGQYALP